MSSWLRDVTYSLRLLAKRPGFTAVAILSLALGIGANTAIFTIINAVFLHPLAIADPARVMEVFTHDTRTLTTGNQNLTASSIQNFEDYRARNEVFSSLAAYFPFGLPWRHDGQVEGLPVTMTSANYFDTLGIRPFQGRFFTPNEDTKEPIAVAVLSHGVWQNRLGSNPNVVGTTINLGGIPFSIIGVAPQGFKGTQALAGAENIWIPLGMREQVTTGQLRTLSASRRFRWISMAGRLKEGVTQTQATSAMKTIASALEQEYPEANGGRTVVLASVSDAALGINQRTQFVRAGGVLMGVVALVLLIACVNLANLQLAQSAKREKEISLRAALGAGRGRLVRQLVIESLVLSAAGGLAGLAVAYWGRNALWAWRPPFLNAAAIDVSFDWKVLTFTAVSSIVTGLVFGILPALRLSRLHLNDVLKVGARGGSLDPRHARTRSVLVAAEIALATVALVGSGLFVRSMQAAEHSDLGFDALHAGFVRLNPGGQRYEPARGQQFYLEAIEKARSVRDVTGAAVVSLVPLAGGAGVLLTTFPEDQATGPTARGALIAYNDITPGFFDAMKIPLLEGRDFGIVDRDSSAPVVILNQAAARQLWPGGSALHKKIKIVNRPEVLEVVGITATNAINAVGEEPTPMIYRPMTQEYAPAAALVFRTSGEPDAAIGPVRDAVQTLDKNMPMRGTGTIREQIGQGLWAPRMGAALLSIFGFLALALAMIGVFGVMSYSVSQRTQEIGVRMALGARAGDVLFMVMRQGLVVVLAGTAAGVLFASLAGRLSADLLYGIQPYDPITLAGVTVILAVVALVACYIPARRATRVNPILALRNE
jgi:macrolide transport system ATP-binding/permease protein